MPSSRSGLITAVFFVTLGLAIAGMSFYVAEVDDAPGAGGIGLIVGIAAVLLAVRAVRNRLPVWPGRLAIVAGLVLLVFAMVITRSVAASVPLFADSPEVPSTTSSAPSPEWAPAVDAARAVVRAAILEQNLPGVSVAVAAGGNVVWAEGFGYRDVGTRTPVTSDTRFHIGTAARVVSSDSAASLDMPGTGADDPFTWSPEAIGEPGEDFPLFTMVRHGILQPLGLAPREYPLPGDRATFYVPSASDNNPRRGRRLMYMRDLACCADHNRAFSSTPTDLVRFAQATGAGEVTGELAGGPVVTFVTRNGVSVAVASNIAFADTPAIAAAVADVFAATR